MNIERSDRRRQPARSAFALFGHAPSRTPTTGLLLGLLITCTAVATYSFYTTRQIKGLRDLQRDLGDRNRKDSLQLLRI